MDIDLIQFIWMVLAVPIGMLANYFRNLDKDHKASRKKIWVEMDLHADRLVEVETKLRIIEDREKNKHETI
ncbi:hypothetical protein KAR91_46545 [Candidatus Pacearchaeota archaeon]|nr:hypothetical protein [Candidatus Pacearchaeota archaeon]